MLNLKPFENRENLDIYTFLDQSRNQWVRVCFKSISIGDLTPKGLQINVGVEMHIGQDSIGDVRWGPAPTEVRAEWITMALYYKDALRAFVKNGG